MAANDESDDAGPDWRADKRAAIEEWFEASTPGDFVTHTSPGGRYELEVRDWHKDKGWSYSEGLVRTSGGGEAVAVVRRNYPAFPFSWIEGHDNGHDYLLCGEDYQGQTIIELDTGERRDYVPDGAEQGAGFCWAAHHPTPAKDVLIVDGCYWACPYELVAFDFTDPLALPYQEVHRWSGDLHTVDGFNDEGVLTWTFEQEERLSDGKPYQLLTEQEEDELTDESGKYIPGLLGIRTYSARWRAGDPFDDVTIEPVTA